MKTIAVEMVTPEKVALQATAELVVLPAFRGEMGVLPGHMPFVVELTPGEVRVTSEGRVSHYAVAGGFAEIGKDKVSVFAETAEMAGEIDTERARQSLERAKAQTLRRDIDPLVLEQAESAIRRAQVRLRVAELRRGQHRPEPHMPQE